MIRDLERMNKGSYDLLVIGGGINGASIAHLAARAGFSVALLEKGDFASGTSSKSTKLIHGGLRYLENLEIDLVYESLKERKLQLKAAPHLVGPLAFVIPVYEGDKRPLWMMRFGVFLYDLIAGPYKVGPHQSLSKEKVLELEPGLEKEGLKGGVLYHDAQMDDARLCLENVLSADAAGAHVANYAKVTDYLRENGRVTGVRAVDLLSRKTFGVCAKRIIVAGGPWSNELLRLDDPKAPEKVRTTKGIHIVYRDKLSNHALFIPSKSDKRIFFVIPWLGHSLIGTTDTDYRGSADDVKVEPADVAYLMNETRRVFPRSDLSEGKILSTFAGLRPLVKQGGSASKVSRKHLFYRSPSGVIFVVGGKYTTYRKVAEDCLKRVFKKRDCPSWQKTGTDPFSAEAFQVCGSGSFVESDKDVSCRPGLDTDVVRELEGRYGSRSREILKMCEESPALGQKVSNDPPVIKAQLVYAVRNEMARTVEDITERRLPLSYLGPVPESVLSAAGEVLEMAARGNLPACGQIGAGSDNRRKKGTGRRDER